MFINCSSQITRISLIYTMTDIIYKEESYKIIGACMEVHPVE